MKTSIAGSISLLFLGIHLTLAQTWTLTGAPTNGWVSVACSADGSVVVAAAGEMTINGTTSSTNGPVYISTNYGATWAQANLPITNWTEVLLSADGSKVFATSPGAGTFVSTNSGVNFSTNATLQFSHMTCSADGTKVYGVAGGRSDDLYASTNSGGTWVFQLLANIEALALVESPDGSKIFAASEHIYFAANPSVGSLNWTEETNSPYGGWASLALSVDGTKFVGAVSGPTYGPGTGYPVGIFTSTNSGTTWGTNTLTLDWDSLASSADGSRLAAAASDPFGYFPFEIILSTNSGITWTTNAPTQEPGTFWSSVASSADGGTLYAALDGGGIWMSQTAIAPQLNVVSSNSILALSWIVPSTNFVLQQSPDLMNWSTLTNAPCLFAPKLEEQVALSPTNTSSFFRLVSQ